MAVYPFMCKKKRKRDWYRTEAGIKYLERTKLRRTEYARKWKQKNPSKAFHSKNRIKRPFVVLCYYVNGNSKKVLKRKGFLSDDFYKLKPSDLLGVAKRQKLLCPFTGIKLTAQNISVDHIVPLSKGGSNRVDNIRLVHNMVNRMRLEYSDEEFIQMCHQISDYARTRKL